MARSVVSLAAGVWTQLAVGPVIVTVHVEGLEGQLQLNTAQDSDTALFITKGRAGDQISQYANDQTTHAKATASGWIVAVDTE